MTPFQPVRPERSRRARKTLTTHELARFLDLLADTGNFALACLRLGRAKSGLYKRRARDPLFDATCRGAVARAQAALWRTEGDRRPGADGKSAFVLGRYAGRPQLRRAVPGVLTEAGRERFLYGLALSGNIRFAAASAGIAHSSILYRRRTDPAFGREIEAALDAALAGLEMRLIEATGVFDENPSPLAGEGESAELTGERGPDTDSAHPELDEGFTTRMTVSQAINLVGRLQRRSKGGL